MNFIFGSCFEPQGQTQDHIFEKQYDPRVSLLPEAGPKVSKAVERKVSTIPNKLRARGDFKKFGTVKDYDDLALKKEMYEQFLLRKRSNQLLWGEVFESK